MAKYNGWTNWETWNTNLWIDNEYAWYEMKRDFLRHHTDGIDQYDVEQFIRELLPEGTPDMQNKDDWYKGREPIDFADITESWEEEWEEIHGEGAA